MNALALLTDGFICPSSQQAVVVSGDLVKPAGIKPVATLAAYAKLSIRKPTPLPSVEPPAPTKLSPAIKAAVNRVGTVRVSVGSKAAASPPPATPTTSTVKPTVKASTHQHPKLRITKDNDG